MSQQTAAVGGSQPRGSESSAGTPGMVAMITSGRSATASEGGGAGGSTGSAGHSASGGTAGGDVDGGPRASGSSAAAGSAGPRAATEGDAATPVTDYSQPGAFTDAKMFTSVGPDGNYTVFRPDASLGKDGFKHPIIGWANGIGTTPDLYQETLTLIASHGFVIIGSNDTQAEEPVVAAGLDWLVEQDTTDGPFKDKLDVSSEGLIGYSWGGGAVIDASRRPNVKGTVCMHGMPPRAADSFDAMHAPLLLFTSTGDTFVTAEGYVTPNYNASKVQTFYATLDDPTAGHMYGLDAHGLEGCSDIGEALGFGACKGAEAERGPVIAWLSLWLKNDQNARKFFYGDDCILCSKPWTMPQRKMWP